MYTMNICAHCNDLYSENEIFLCSNCIKIICFFCSDCYYKNDKNELIKFSSKHFSPESLNWGFNTYRYIENIKDKQHVCQNCFIDSIFYNIQKRSNPDN